jgi:1-acyl-sn-glycerol-3-phosphate acyltransferase
MLPPDLPPIKNKILYGYRVFAKWFAFFAFGLCSLIMAILVLPPMRLVLRTRNRFSKYARRFVSFTMRGYIIFMHILKIVDLEVRDRGSFRQLSSKIIIANHPSILDVVMLLSLIPNADCVVSPYLNRSVIGGVIRQLYILSSLDYYDLMNACVESLEQGNCLIIFPEGTRTPRTGKVLVKKGAARVALASGCDIIPVHIGGTDKYGLGKKDPWAGFNPNERYIYRINMGNEIHIENYKTYSRPAATRTITKDIEAILFTEKRQ